MAKKKHRLLHTLVFSSALAVGGCGAAAPAPLEPAAETSYAEAETSTALVTTQAEPVAIANMDSPYAAGTAGSDAGSALRYCENGWPTTKGASLRCETSTDAEGESETVCCDGMYSGDADFGTDAAQCCVVES